MSHAYHHHHHHLYSAQQPPAPSQSSYTLPVQHNDAQQQQPVVSQSQPGYPPLNYPQSSAGSTMPISTYIPPVQTYEPPIERCENPPQIQRPTPILAEREVIPAPAHLVPQTPTSAAPMSFHLQQQQSSPAPPSPGPSGMIPGGGPDLEHDLPAELLQQGWRKFWSKRENRIYFWNKANGESLWEMPPLRSSVSYHSTITLNVANSVFILVRSRFGSARYPAIHPATRRSSQTTRIQRRNRKPIS